MKNLQFFSREAADRLAADIAKNVEKYKLGATSNLIGSSDSRLSKIEVPDAPILVTESGECKSDAECSKLVYQWFSRLTPVQAADDRLWAYLTHVVYADYMHKRWKTGLQRAEKPQDVILDRWFFKGEGARTKMHNGISRLWWFGHVTHDPERGNAFELTDVLLSLQDIQTAFLERSLGLCRPLIKVVLEVIQKFSPQLEITPKRGDLIQEWAKEIHLIGGAFLLDAVPEERLIFVVEQSLRRRLSA